MQIADLIYGTFPDLPGSQQVVHRSDSIDETLLEWLITSYDRFGDCRSEEFKNSVTVVWYRHDPSNPLTCITKVTQQSKDFSGRWGALLRHTVIVPQAEYERHACLPLLFASRLVESGGSEELGAREDLQLEIAQPLHSSEIIAGASIESYKENIGKLLLGERLVLYSDALNDYLSGYLSTLVALLPLQARRMLNWSQFLFREWEALDLSVVYNSRYEAPTGGPVTFAAQGKNLLSALQLSSADVASYLDRLERAFAAEDHAELAALLDSEDWRSEATTAAAESPRADVERKSDESEN